MQRVFEIALATLLVCLCILGITALGVFLHIQYGDAPSRVAELEKRMNKLESRPRWTTRAWRDTITNSTNKISSTTLYLTNGVTTAQRFTTSPPKQARKKVVAVWLTNWSPRSEILKFDEFNVFPYDYDKVMVIAKPGTNAPISMNFTVTAIFE